MFDTRSVVLSMGTLFYGTIPGVIAGVVAAAYRASEGGPGAVMGVSVCVMSVVVGAAWRRWRHVARRDPGVLELYLFGLTVHVLMLALTVTLPRSIAGDTFRDIALPVIVIYPLASVLLGLLMIDQRRRRRVGGGAAAEREALRGDRRPPSRPAVDPRPRPAVPLRQSAAGGRPGSREDELIGKTPEDLWEPGLAASSRALCERALRGEVVDITERWPDDTGGYFRSLVFAVQGRGRGRACSAV